jgi:hypothetical protein
VTQAQILQHVMLYAIQAGFWAAISFPLITAFYWPWWRSLWGLTIVALDLAIALALLGSVLAIEFGFGLTQSGALAYAVLWVTAVSLCAIPLIITWRAVLTFTTQRRGEEEDRE